MRNYFNYFTEIEDKFQQRRGSLLMLSTVDWALIDAWRSCGIPLEAVLRGIDDAFDKHEAKRPTGRLAQKKINGLAWCAQSVMQATEEMAEAAIGSASAASGKDAAPHESGFEGERISRYLRTNADAIAGAETGDAARPLVAEVAEQLRALALEIETTGAVDPEALESTLIMLEERAFAALKLDTPASEMQRLNEDAIREIAPHRARMQGPQLRMVQDQFLLKRLLQQRNLPRLSLFYMSHE